MYDCEVENAKVFARTHRYKLYRDGNFYEVPKDLLEEHPLAVHQLQDQAKADYQLLKKVLKKYQGKRLNANKSF